MELSTVIDTTINLGHLLTIGSILVTGVGVYTGIVVRLASTELKITILEAQQLQLYNIIKDISQLQRDVAVIRDRIDRDRVPK